MGILVRAKSSIYGLTADLAAINQAISDEQTARAAADGVLANLTTTEKSSLVGAANEIHAAVQAATTTADGALQSAANLGDLADAAAARSNLDVMSTAEVQAAVTAAELALGTNFSVADIAGRDALQGLDLADRIFVADDGDEKWAIYSPSSLDGQGAGFTWTKLADQDALENAISAPAIKAAYESNADTNVFSDAEKTLLGLISATQAVDLDDVVLKAGLAQTISGAGAADVAPSTAAVAAAVSAGGATPKLESLVVASGAITLSFAPKGGLGGVMNFATVRYVSPEGIAYDAPLVATGDTKVFSVSTDTANQWDGFTVQVQYLHVAE